MKQNSKIAMCGVISALGIAIMLLAYFPYFTYLAGAVAGFLTVIVVAETDKKWALATFIVTGLLSLFFAETEAKIMYLLFFGYYPILKICIENIKSKTVQYIIKFTLFNCAVVGAYSLLTFVFGLPPEILPKYGIYGIVGILLLANVTFYIYDIALVRMAGIYMYRVHPSVKKIFKSR